MHTHRNTQTRSACKAQLLSKHHHPSSTAVWLRTASAWNPLHLTAKATCECERMRQRERWNEERVCKWMNQLASSVQDMELRVTGSHDAFPWVLSVSLSVSLCFSGCKERERGRHRWSKTYSDPFTYTKVAIKPNYSVMHYKFCKSTVKKYYQLNFIKISKVKSLSKEWPFSEVFWVILLDCTILLLYLIATTSQDGDHFNCLMYCWVV